MSRKRKKKSGKIEIIMLYGHQSCFLIYRLQLYSTVQTTRKESRILVHEDISIYFIC